MENIKKIGYLLLLGVVLYFLLIYVIKIFSWLINILLLLGLVATAYWLYKKLNDKG